MGRLDALPSEILDLSIEKALASLKQFGVAIKDGQFKNYLEFIPIFAFIRLKDNGTSLPGTLVRYERGLLKEL